MCCKGCHNFINAVNEVYKNAQTIIEVREFHDIQTAWKQPLVCFNYDKEHQIGMIYLEKEIISKLKKLAPALKEKIN